MRRFIAAAVLAVALAVPVVASAQGVDPIEARLTANVATMQHYVDNLFAHQARHRLSARQEAALAHDLDTLDLNQRTLVAYQAGHPQLPDVTAIPLGPTPIANNALPNTETYGCPGAFDVMVFEAQHRKTIEAVYSDIVTAILRPDLNRYQALVGIGGFTQLEANTAKQGDVTRQAAALDYFAGRVPFSAIAGSFGAWYRYLGCVNIAAIHDLGG